MEGKTVIITGANGGIGKEATIKIAGMGAKVIMACRNLEAANKVRVEIEKNVPGAMLLVKKLDTSDLESIRNFAKDINASEKRLDVLIHNAGIGGGVIQSGTTKDGLNLTMATNHFGSFLLTHLLIDLLKKSAPSRIVFVSSKLYFCSSCNAKNMNSYTLPYFLYCRSKRANLMFSKELSKRLQGTGVTSNSVHPGVVDTGIFRHVPFPFSLLFDLMRRYMKTAEEGSLTTVYAATEPSLERVSGKYFRDSRESQLRFERWFNDSENRQFFDACKKMVKLTDDDPKI